MLSLVIFCGKLLKYQRARDLKSLPHQSHQFFSPNFPEKSTGNLYTWIHLPRLSKVTQGWNHGFLESNHGHKSLSRMTVSGTSRSLGFLWAGTEWRHHDCGFEWWVVSSGVSPAILGIFPLELGILPHPLPISTPPTPGMVKLGIFRPKSSPVFWNHRGSKKGLGSIFVAICHFFAVPPDRLPRVGSHIWRDPVERLQAVGVCWSQTFIKSRDEKQMCEKPLVQFSPRFDGCTFEH